MALPIFRYIRSMPLVFAIMGRAHMVLAWLSFCQLRNKTSHVRFEPIATVSGERRRRLLLDVWSIDQGVQSGVQRVSRELAVAIRRESPPGWSTIQLAFSPNTSKTLLQAKAEFSQLVNGDAFFALDTNLDVLPLLDNEIRAMRERGVLCVGLIHDVLPLSNPEWFKLGFVRRFQRWAMWLAQAADHLICDSRATSEAIQTWLPGWSDRKSDITTLPLAGVALHANEETSSGSPVPCSRPYLLMVGTLEPRKAHASVLTAFERLWRDDINIALVIAGKPGWYTEWLQSKLRRHSEFGVRLFWFDNVDDSDLIQLYLRCRGVIAASYAEGFGLPLAEARRFGKPVLARKIAPFLEQDGPSVSYFEPNVSVHILAKEIKKFVEESNGFPSIIYKDSGDLLQQCANLVWEQMNQTANQKNSA